MPSSDVDDPPAHLVAGAPGHVPVEHRDVVPVHAEPLQRRVAVVADVDGHRELAQPLGDRVGEQPLVVGHSAHARFRSRICIIDRPGSSARA